MDVLETTASPLACTTCGKELVDCKCPDIDARLAELGGPDGSMIFRKDQKCGKHYARCKCPDPVWVYSNNGKEMTQANRLQRKGQVRR
jgi:hypothetical protein